LPCRLISAAVADPAIIAPMVDSVLMTVCVHKNGRRPVEHAVRILDDVGIQPAAVIVNGMESETKGSYGYGSYSREQYGYIGHYHGRYAAADTTIQSATSDAHPEHRRTDQRTDYRHRTIVPAAALTHTTDTSTPNHQTL